MKTLPFALFTLLALIVGARAQDQIVYDNALENGWVSYGWATLNYANTSPVHSASDSISVVDSTNTAQALYLHHPAFDPSLYSNLTFWIYPTVAKTNELHVQATLNGAAQTAVNLSFTAAQVGQWQQVTIPLSNLGVAGNASFDGFWIQNITGGPLTFYVDDISLTAIPPPNPVPLTVDGQNVIRTFDARVHGINLAIWDSNLQGAATANVLSTMDIGIVRFPGGSSSDDYDWSTDRSVSNGSFQWANHASAFARVAETAGAQAFITINYGSGTPEQAAAWVAYYNGSTTNTASLGVDSKGHDWKTVGFWATIRSSAPLASDDGYNFLRVSHPAPYGYRYWEIGNECYGSWENDLHGASGSGLTGVAHDPYTYAQAFPSFYTKMLAVDPTIHIGAVSTEGEDSYGNGTHAVANPNEGNSLHSGWTPVMLATLHSLNVTPHFLIYHYYAQNPGGESDSGLLQSGATIAVEAANLRKMIGDYFGAGGTAIELTVTELNSVSSNPGKQSTSLVNGLFFVDAIGQLTRTEFNACTWWDLRNGGGTGGNNNASLYGWRTFGDYGVVASGDISGTPANTPFPSFYAGKLLGLWAQSGSRILSTTSGYPLLAIYGSKLANGSLALLVVNKHPSSDFPAQLGLSDFTPGSTTATVYSYGKQNDLESTDITTGTATLSGTTLNYTFPSYSMSVVVVKGQFEAWREQHFTTAELNNPSISGDNAEPANDGVTNLVKYALGLDPKTPSATGVPALSNTALSGKKYLTLTFTQWRSLTDITYQAEVSSDLETWQSGSPYTVRVDNGSTDTAVYRDATAIGDVPRHYIRLSVVRP
ncbi:Alpha-L-arabinofuranosidase-like protein [Chthoniobacter flavus Ellin428]|uniref:Alpha-L-arabinofuranosidase-like protein n=1 Tax=Chthoniobacter flavus Ellin428 TaxID=497964 RepID=B4D146_9BACT|nr:hypothetical protein [Chthoniobacter flavus]EDY20058.1 Alpha-L-arabinofuranosidase-like protein [Chthoniobacter flavus Ellin428]TCO93955.1 hypothetical protein EV701_10341 [Chthoniobacter flavus]